MAKFSVCRIYKVTLWLNFSYNYSVNLLQISHLYIHPYTINPACYAYYSQVHSKTRVFRLSLFELFCLILAINSFRNVCHEDLERRLHVLYAQHWRFLSVSQQHAWNNSNIYRKELSCNILENSY